jgi:uncharacterized protein (TIGR02996 family)
MPAKTRQPPPSAGREKLALLAAVKETPDDDAPRLVLADWLEEHGDEDDRAHAELLRVQCELLRRSAELIDPQEPGRIHDLLRGAGHHVSTLPYQFDALTKKDSRLAGLKQRQDELITSFQPRWWKDLVVPHRCEWHRGLASLDLSLAPLRSRDANYFADSEASHWVEGLRLEATPSQSARVARFRLLARPVALEMDGIHLTDDSLATVLSSPHLSGLQRLEKLFVRDADVFPLTRLTSLDRLTALYLYSNNLTQEGLGLLADWPSIRSLRVLHLGGGGYDFGPTGAAGLARAPFLAGLRELGLTNCSLGDAGLEALLSSTLFACPALFELDMNDLGPEGARLLLDAAGLERVAVLEISRNRLNDRAVDDLASSPRLAGLLRLDLSENEAIGPAGAEALAASPHLSRLVSLNLNQCPIGDSGAYALARSPYLPRLSNLLVNEDELSAAAVAVLQERYDLT